MSELQHSKHPRRRLTLEFVRLAKIEAAAAEAAATAVVLADQNPKRKVPQKSMFSQRCNSSLELSCYSRLPNPYSNLHNHNIISIIRRFRTH